MLFVENERRIGMWFISFILFLFLGICLIVGLRRAIRVIVKGINYLFDRVEEKIEGK